MSTESSRMTGLYKRLKTAGLDPKYVKTVLLPEWWVDSLATTKSGFFHGASLIATRAGAEIESLIQQDAPISCRNFGITKFKKKRNADHHSFKWAESIAASVAELVGGVTIKLFQEVSLSALRVRRQILIDGSKFVSLPSLLAFCWGFGIPVVFVGNLPKGSRKIDGMVVRISGRPVIVVSNKCKHDSWIIFIIAHELGHICCGHVKDGVIVDEVVNGIDTDGEEAEANNFAVELLTGSPNTRYNFGAFFPAHLIRMANEITNGKNVDPGVAILNYAFHHASQGNEWGMVRKALNQLEPDANAPKTIHARMLGDIDLKGLDDEQREYLDRLTAPSDENVPVRQ